MDKSKKQLILENEALHSRLGDIEQTLKAIRSGDVDAIVVPGSKGDQVYSISSAEMPYRTFIEEMNEGAVTLSKEGIILYCNQKFAEFVNERIESVMGTYLKYFFIARDQSKLDRLLSKQTHKKNDVLEISLFNSLILKLSFHLLPAYLQGDNFILIATDITEMKKRENELLELHRLLKKQISQLKYLRIDLINNKIENEAALNNLKITNDKLSKEISDFNLLKTELQPKPGKYKN